jgi:hypothetical protein
MRAVARTAAAAATLVVCGCGSGTEVSPQVRSVRGYFADLAKQSKGNSRFDVSGCESAGSQFSASQGRNVDLANCGVKETKPKATDDDAPADSYDNWCAVFDDAKLLGVVYGSCQM